MNQTTGRETEPRLIVTMAGPWPGTPEVLVPSQLGSFRFLFRFIRASRHAHAIILRGTSGLHEHYIELIAALLLRSLGNRGPKTVIGDATWDLSSRRLECRLPLAAAVLPRLARLAIRCIDNPRVLYCVLSSHELQHFPARWGVAPSRTCFVPFCATMAPSRRKEALEGDYIFAGGDSYRDYDLLVDAVSDLDVPVRIASSWSPRRSLAPNIHLGWLSQTAYDRALLNAKVVVVPLRAAARSAGQQTYLNAMLMGKPVIVTDSPGVRDYIIDHVTGLVVASRAQALREAIDWVLDASNRPVVMEMAAKGRQLVENAYLMEHYFERLWALATSC